MSFSFIFQVDNCNIALKIENDRFISITVTARDITKKIIYQYESPVKVHFDFHEDRTNSKRFIFNFWNMPGKYNRATGEIRSKVLCFTFDASLGEAYLDLGTVSGHTSFFCFNNSF